MTSTSSSGDGFAGRDADLIDTLVALPRQIDPAIELAAQRIASRRARLDDLVAAVRYDYCTKDYS
jgi:hypothetical protein